MGLPSMRTSPIALVAAWRSERSAPISKLFALAPLRAISSPSMTRTRPLQSVNVTTKPVSRTMVLASLTIGVTIFRSFSLSLSRIDRLATSITGGLRRGSIAMLRHRAQEDAISGLRPSSLSPPPTKSSHRRRNSSCARSFAMAAFRHMSRSRVWAAAVRRSPSLAAGRPGLPAGSPPRQDGDVQSRLPTPHF
jgi:hypothetical protein